LYAPLLLWGDGTPMDTAPRPEATRNRSSGRRTRVRIAWSNPSDYRSRAAAENHILNTRASLTMHRAIISFFVAVAASSFGLAQPISKTPAEAEATIGGKTIAVKYKAASANGRTIFGSADALLQPNTVWRAGAGSSPTTLYTNAALKLGGLAVPPGQYTLFVLLDPKGWQLIVSKEKGAAAQVYHESQDLGRVAMTTAHPSTPVETMKFSVNAAGGNTGTLQLEWADVSASVPFAVQ
jgi:hypothetical protein